MMTASLRLFKYERGGSRMRPTRAAALPSQRIRPIHSMSTDATPPGFSPVWIAPDTPLPDCCMSCGMFTDVTVKVTVNEQETSVQPAGSSAPVQLLGCLLFPFGPIGMVISALLSQSADKEMVEKTKTVRRTLRVPQCRLCTGMKKIEPVTSIPEGPVCFEVHPNFVSRLQSDTGPRGGR